MTFLLRKKKAMNVIEKLKSFLPLLYINGQERPPHTLRIKRLLWDKSSLKAL